MEKYNLDDKVGLLKFLRKKASKLLLKEDTVELKHFSNINSLKMRILDVTDSTVKLQAIGDISGLTMVEQDHIVMNYFSNKNYYSIVGRIASIDSADPLELTININTIKKSSTLTKEQKKYVSFPGTISISSSVDAKSPSVLKVMGLRAVKVECKQEFKTGDIVDVLINLDKASKLIFKGEIIRKGKAGNLFEYGIEVREITESNSKLMHRCVGGNIND